MSKLRELPVEEYVLQGHAACPGCGLTISLRTVLKALGPKTIMVVPACCTSIIQSPFPTSSINVPLINVAFASAAAVAAGISRALRSKGDYETTVLAWAGDGGTADIGLQALSGAAERGDDIIYICYDNEAYMNTGVQRSGSTPMGAKTTTTWTGKKEEKKNIPLIIAAHEVPYVATATIGYIFDLYDKVLKAKSKRGFRYLHLLSPCPPGWFMPSEKSVEITKLAVQTGMFPLFEVEDGVFRLTGISKTLVKKSRRKPVKLYLEAQGRFKHLKEEDILRIQEWVDMQWERYAEMNNKKIF